MLVALLIVLAPLALGSPTASVVRPPYKHAVVQPGYDEYRYGCGAIKISHQWGFDRKSGMASINTNGKATTCRYPQYGYGTYGNIYDYGQVYVGIPFHIATGATHLQVNVSASWIASLTASDGGTPVCGNYASYDDTSVSTEWGYVSTAFGSGFTYYNSSYANLGSSPWSSVWSNGTSGNAPVPSPFHENATSLLSWSHSWGSSAYCESYAGGYVTSYAQLLDRSNGTYVPQTGDTIGDSGTLFALFVETVNQTQWACSNSTYWNGPSATWSNSTRSCTTWNSTVDSYWYTYVPTYTYSSGHNNSVTASNISATSGSWYWNYSFNGRHNYELFFYFYGQVYGYTTWPSPGFASYRLDIATGGTGYRVTSISSY